MYSSNSSAIEHNKHKTASLLMENQCLTRSKMRDLIWDINFMKPWKKEKVWRSKGQTQFNIYIYACPKSLHTFPSFSPSEATLTLSSALAAVFKTSQPHRLPWEHHCQVASISPTSSSPSKLALAIALQWQSLQFEEGRHFSHWHCLLPQALCKIRLTPNLVQSSCSKYEMISYHNMR